MTVACWWQRQKLGIAPKSRTWVLRGMAAPKGHVLGFEDAVAGHGCLNPAGNPDLVLHILLHALTTVLPGTSRALQLILAQNNCCTSSGVESRQDGTVHLSSVSTKKRLCPHRAPELGKQPCPSITSPCLSASPSQGLQNSRN